MDAKLQLRHKSWLVFLLGTISATAPLSIDLYLPALPDIATDLHAQPSLVQLSLSACLIGLALGQLIFGPLSDKYGRKRPLIIGFLGFGVVSLMIAYSHSIYSLIFLRFIQGVTGASGEVLSRAVASDLFSGPLLTKFLSMLAAVNGIFPVIAPVIGGFIVRYVEWQGAFILLALIGFLLTTALWVGIKETLPPDQRMPGGVWLPVIKMFTLLKSFRFVCLIVATGLVSGGLFSYISASSFVFQNYFHMSIESFSILYAINGLGIAIGSLIPSRFAGRMSERKQTRIVLASTVITTILLTISAIFFQNLFTVVTLIFLTVTQFGILFTLTTSIVMNLSSQNNGELSAMVGLSQNAIGGVMSPLVGLLGTATYLPMSVTIMSCIFSSMTLFHAFETRS